MLELEKKMILSRMKVASLYLAETPPNLTKRQNFDNSHNIVNDHGKQLLDLCKTCDLRILNGRSKGDTLGKFTFHSINGISTVDYIIVSHDLFTSVQGFAVKQPNIFSDHSQIVCWIKTGADLSNNNNSFQERNNVKLPQQYVWAAKFTAAFRSDAILSLLHLFESTNFDLSSTDVENATNQFTNIMTEAAKRSLKLSSQKKSKRKPITKKWFDYDCKTLRSSLKKLSNKKHRNPLDTELRKQYHVQNKTFKKLIKQKKTTIC